MINKSIKTAITTSLALACIACSTTVPNNNMHLQSEYFNEPNNDLSFSTKELSESYIRRKIIFWLESPVKGHQLVKEISYGIYKYRETLCDVITADNNLLLDQINEVGEVQTRISVDTAFGEFLAGCGDTPPQASGGEFQVNTFTTDGQNSSSVAMDDDGDFVVTWHSYGQDGDAIAQSNIYAQRYNSSGIPQGPEFRVNSFTTGGQLYPAIAMDSDGDFVISWDSYGQDGSNFGIYAQRYNSSGAAQGSEFQVNTFTTGGKYYSSVAIDDDGDFVISWNSNGQDGSNFGIYAQRYNSSGIPQGPEFQVNTFTTGNQLIPSIAIDNDGDFVISWNSYGQDGDSIGNSNIYAQRYNSSGIPQGPEFRVNSFTTSLQNSSSVAIDDAGDFVISWDGAGNGDNPGIYAQRYNSSGIPQGSEFLVNSFTTGKQRGTSIAMDSDGDFVISWNSLGQDGSSYGIYAQRYNSSGVPQGSEFQVNTYTTSFQIDPSATMDNSGNFVITWTSPGQDGGSYGVFGQRYNSSGVPQ
jgi:hypothetical protein